MDHTADTPVAATLVADNDRLQFLPTSFPGCFYAVEHHTYAWARALCAEYSGAYWEFVTLSNGGAFLHPRCSEGFEVRVNGNGFAGKLSPEAFGLVATMFALSHLSHTRGLDAEVCDVLCDRYQQLLAYAAGHPEAGPILRAID